VSQYYCYSKENGNQLDATEKSFAVFKLAIFSELIMAFNFFTFPCRSYIIGTLWSLLV